MAAGIGGMTAHLSVRVGSLTRRFGTRAILNNINAEIHAGEFVALLGRSGSGKSTFLRALAGIDRDTSGGGTIRVPARRAVLFQDARLLPWATVLDNVLLGTEERGADPRARAVLAEVGLKGRERDWPKTLSGGEQQRVALARSLIREPELLLLDEPFSALDALTKIQMQALLADVWKRHAPAALLVTHDVDEALILADRILILDAGRIASDICITAPRPRVASNTEIVRLRNKILQQLGVEIASSVFGSERKYAG